MENINIIITAAVMLVGCLTYYLLTNKKRKSKKIILDFRAGLDNFVNREDMDHSPLTYYLGIKEEMRKINLTFSDLELSQSQLAHKTVQKFNSFIEYCIEILERPKSYTEGENDNYWYYIEIIEGKRAHNYTMDLMERIIQYLMDFRQVQSEFEKVSSEIQVNEFEARILSFLYKKIYEKIEEKSEKEDVSAYIAKLEKSMNKHGIELPGGCSFAILRKDRLIAEAKNTYREFCSKVDPEQAEKDLEKIEKILEKLDKDFEIIEEGLSQEKLKQRIKDLHFQEAIASLFQVRQEADKQNVRDLVHEMDLALHKAGKTRGDIPVTNEEITELIARFYLEKALEYRNKMNYTKDEEERKLAKVMVNYYLRIAQKDWSDIGMCAKTGDATN